MIIRGTIEGSVGETTNGSWGHTGGPKNRKKKNSHIGVELLCRLKYYDIFTNQQSSEGDKVIKIYLTSDL